MAALFILACESNHLVVASACLTCRLTLEELSLRLPEAVNLRVRCLRRAPGTVAGGGPPAATNPSKPSAPERL